MELKLNIYEKNKIVKTYTAQDFTLETGICEDIMCLVDFDKFAGKMDVNELGFEILKVVQKSFSKFRPFLQDIFDGLTDEEYRHTSIKEVAGIVLDIVNHTFNGLLSIRGNSKN